jgi:threonine/homoserine/homoserine lactone efflux protein
MQMDFPVTAFGILGAILLGAISPGPSFVLVARTAVAVSRRDALATAFGMGVGGLVFAGAALLGLMVVLASVPWLYLVIRVIGASYLLYLALCLWKGANDPLETTDVRGGDVRGIFRSFGFGLATQLSNPKTAIWYASVFAALLSADQPRGLAAVVLPMIFLIEAGWYALVAVAFSSAGPRRGYLRLKTWIDRVAGGIIGLLGLKRLWEAR